MQLRHEAHSVSAIGYHLVWCTKFRRQVLVGAIAESLKQTFLEICEEYEWLLISNEVMPEHVHLFIQVSPTDAPVDVVRTLKSITAVKIFTEFPALKKRRFWGSGLWSRGTYYGSVGHISEETVKRYIAEQKSKPEADGRGKWSRRVQLP